MATINDSTPRVHHRSVVPHLPPISSHGPSSIDRHFEQYLLDHHHHLPKLSTIGRSSTNHRVDFDRSFLDSNEFSSPREELNSSTNHGPISRLLNSDSYRRSQLRLIEYRQQSKIPGIALTPSVNLGHDSIHLRHESTIPLKDVIIEATRAKQQQQQQQNQYQNDDLDFVDDDSVLSNESERHRRAKDWIKEHQFFFTEYQ